MARPTLKCALGIVMMFLVTLAYASSEEENVYFEYDRAIPVVKENWVNRPRTVRAFVIKKFGLTFSIISCFRQINLMSLYWQGEISQAKRAMAILNRLFMVAQRTNKSQRPHQNEDHLSQTYQLPHAAKSAARNDEVLNDVNSLENNSDGGPISLDQKAMALPRVRNGIIITKTRVYRSARCKHVNLVTASKDFNVRRKFLIFKREWSVNIIEPENQFVLQSRTVNYT